MSWDFSSVLEVPFHVRFQILITSYEALRIFRIMFDRLLLVIAQKGLVLIVLVFSDPPAFRESENARQ